MKYRETKDEKIFKKMIGMVLLTGLISACAPQETKTETKPNTQTSTSTKQETNSSTEISSTSSPTGDENNGDAVKVATTVNIISDLVYQIGREKVDVVELMGPGVDPHLYKATAGDVEKLEKADLIIYSGLHLEGKINELLEKNEKAHAVTDVFKKEDLIIPPGGFDGNTGMPDPHVWFDVSLWKNTAIKVGEILAEKDPKNADYYKNNAKEYFDQLEVLDKAVEEEINTIPEEKRILITAHDAFNYYGRRYGIQVEGIQGISTTAEASIQDIQAISNLIKEKKVPVIFVESSVSPKTIEAVAEAVKSDNYDLKIGEELYSDALGAQGTAEGNYIGMIRYNTHTIVEALK